jgi:exosome complex component RRP42
MPESIISAIKRDYLYKLAQAGKRADGRGVEEYREIVIEPEVITQAEGSARVKLGNTEVYAGVKIEPGEPYSDSPNSGVLVTNAELIPLASPDFEAGPPGRDAIELARVVDRGIRESGVINLEQLCIEPNKKVWMIFLDLYIIDYNGNLFDASMFDVLAALYTAKIPKERFELGKDVPLPLDPSPPISCTHVKYNDLLVIDPSLDEELIADARLTITLDESSHLRAIQKGGVGRFKLEEIKKVIKTAQSNAKQIREIFRKTLKME